MLERIKEILQRRRVKPAKPKRVKPAKPERKPLPKPGRPLFQLN